MYWKIAFKLTTLSYMTNSQNQIDFYQKNYLNFIIQAIDWY